jgi:spore germination cell wall hydrolase CwlJ-like protein
MNRVKDERYPNNVCDVVKQGLTYKWNPCIPVKHRCQFSWYCDGKSDEIRPTENWYKSQIIALQLMDGKFNGVIEGATHYHASWVYPKWRHTLTYIAQVGDHLFYRWEK